MSLILFLPLISFNISFLTDMSSSAALSMSSNVALLMNSNAPQPHSRYTFRFHYKKMAQFKGIMITCTEVFKDSCFFSSCLLFSNLFPDLAPSLTKIAYHFKTLVLQLHDVSSLTHKKFKCL